MKYILVSRKGCHLCEEAEQVLKSEGISFIWQDVDADSELKQHYTFRVPVLLEAVEGSTHGKSTESKVVLEGKFTPERVIKRIK